MITLPFCMSIKISWKSLWRASDMADTAERRNSWTELVVTSRCFTWSFTFHGDGCLVVDTLMKLWDEWILILYPGPTSVSVVRLYHRQTRQICRIWLNLAWFQFWSALSQWGVSNLEIVHLSRSRLVFTFTSFRKKWNMELYKLKRRFSKSANFEPLVAEEDKDPDQAEYGDRH